jgi:putative flavoprotein involved in K+ transport
MAQAIVCGAGAAGLASAACLKRAGVEPLVLEGGPALGTSWRRRYPALRLNTLGWMSTLPGYRASRRRYGDYPARDDWIRYLEDYAHHHDLAIECGVEVSSIERANGAWRVETDRDAREAPFVVVATGFDREPRIPDWPGRDGFAGELLHAAAYRGPEPFRGRDVLVVGPGVTGSEVAAFLAGGGAGRVRVATRTPPNIVPRWWLGMPMNVPALLLDALPPNAADSLGRLSQRLIYGDLSRYGVPFPPLGIRRTLEERFMGPAVDAGFVSALKEGRIEIVPAVAAFDGSDVILADQSRIQPEVVICATGYRRGLEDLVGHLGLLDENGMPRDWPDIEVDGARNLFFVGYFARVSGQLRQMRYEARRLARRVKRRLSAVPRPAQAEAVTSA